MCDAGSASACAGGGGLVCSRRLRCLQAKKARVTGKVYRRMHKGVIMTDIWSGTAWNCEHGTQRHNCAKCGGRSVCEHGMPRDAQIQAAVGAARREPQSDINILGFDELTAILEVAVAAQVPGSPETSYPVRPDTATRADVGQVFVEPHGFARRLHYQHEEHIDNYASSGGVKGSTLVSDADMTRMVLGCSSTRIYRRRCACVPPPASEPFRFLRTAGAPKHRVGTLGRGGSVPSRVTVRTWRVLTPRCFRAGGYTAGMAASYGPAAPPRGCATTFTTSCSPGARSRCRGSP